MIFLIIPINFSCKTSDWANKARYKKENYTLVEQGIEKNSIVFMGNSITEGWSVHHPEFFRGKPYINRGIGGQTTDQMLERFEQDVIDLNPAIVAVLAGTNDIAENRGAISIEEIANNISEMVLQAKKNDINVILCSVLPAYDYPWRSGLKPNEKIPKLNSSLKNIAQKNDVFFLDYFTAMANSKNGLIEAYGYDGVHPNKTGYSVMESLLENAIKEVLK